jgi:hypothetical protein
MKALLVTREYPPHIYGGAGVVVDQLSRALARRMGVEVRCFGPARAAPDGIALRGYTPWERLGGKDARFAPRAGDAVDRPGHGARPVDADVVHAHTWYADMGALWISTLHRIPLIVTLHSMEPLRPWKADQLGSGYLVSSWIEKTAVESAHRVIAVSHKMREDILATSTPIPRASSSSTTASTPTSSSAPGARRARRLGVRSPYVLFVGRITDQKGIFHLLEAARALAAGVQVVVCAPPRPTRPRSRSGCGARSPSCPNVPLDQRDGAGDRGDAALQPRRRLRLSLRLRAVRPHQPGGDGLRDAGGGLGGGRHPRGRGGRQDRRAGAAGPPDALADALNALLGNPDARARHGPGRPAARRGALLVDVDRRADRAGLRRGHRRVPRSSGD